MKTLELGGYVQKVVSNNSVAPMSHVSAIVFQFGTNKPLALSKSRWQQ